MITFERQREPRRTSRHAARRVAFVRDVRRSLARGVLGPHGPHGAGSLALPTRSRDAVTIRGRVLAMAPAEWFFFDDKERSLVAEVLSFVAEHNPEEARFLGGHLQRLAQAAVIIRESPSIASSWHARVQPHLSGDPLIDLLCRVPDWDLELHIPTKAVLGQAYLVTKINFFKALGYALDVSGGSPRLSDRVHHELGQSIYSKLAEELFVSIVTDPTGKREVKKSAAKLLFQIWEDRLASEVDDFAPVLEAVWEARNKVRPVLGTMRGTQEFFRLIAEVRDDRFLSYFEGAVIPDEEVQAFEEFLFDISHEEITRLRAYLAERGASALSQDEARHVLGRGRESWMPSGGPQALYTSYKKRKIKAHYRSLTGAPGPRKTAEEFVMTAFLSG
jgi:hypothetical protein